MIIPYRDTQPTVGEGVFVAPDAWLIGDVTVGDEVSIFFGAVLRGDILPISVGRGTNIQEHSMLHTSKGRVPTVVGEDVTVGHRALIHGCRVGNRALIGMGSTVLDEADIGDESIVGAGAVVLEKTVIPPRSLAVGVPAKVVRTLSDQEVAALIDSAERYQEKGRDYQQLLKDVTQ